MEAANLLCLHHTCASAAHGAFLQLVRPGRSHGQTSIATCNAPLLHRTGGRFSCGSSTTCLRTYNRMRVTAYAHRAAGALLHKGAAARFQDLWGSNCNTGPAACQTA